MPPGGWPQLAELAHVQPLDRRTFVLPNQQWMTHRNPTLSYQHGQSLFNLLPYPSRIRSAAARHGTTAAVGGQSGLTVDMSSISGVLQRLQQLFQLRVDALHMVDALHLARVSRVSLAPRTHNLRGA